MEIWKDIEGYEGHYQVSNLGRIMSIERLTTSKSEKKPRKFGGIYLKYQDNDGYKMVSLCKNSIQKYMSVHRIVGKAFIPNPNNCPDINHKNLNKSDNRVENLEWVTEKQNIQHAIANGRINHIFGENNHKSILTWELIKQIREEYLLNNKISQSALGKKYGVSKYAITAVISNEHWFDSEYQKLIDSGEVQNRYNQSTDGENNSQAKLTEKDIIYIRQIDLNKQSRAQIAKIYNVSTGCIDNIVTRKSWKHIK